MPDHTRAPSTGPARCGGCDGRLYVLVDEHGTRWLEPHRANDCAAERERVEAADAEAAALARFRR